MQMLTMLGENVRTAREAAGMSQVALAEALRGGEAVGPDADYVRDIEKGRTEPSITRFVQLAWALGVHPADLVDGLEEMQLSN